MRTIPVQKSIAAHNEVMPYEIAEEVARNHSSIAVANCICRQAMRLIGKGCTKPEESCLAFGLAADYVVQTGRGRQISVTESLEILQRADETGLVLQPDNAKDPLFVCTCCGCCCGILRALQGIPSRAGWYQAPSRHAWTPARATGAVFSRSVARWRQSA